jgi:hypothetical protein
MTTNGKKKGRVRGRAKADVDGKTWIFELRPEGLVARRKHTRKSKAKLFKFAELVGFSTYTFSVASAAVSPLPDQHQPELFPANEKKEPVQ